MMQAEIFQHPYASLYDWMYSGEKDYEEEVLSLENLFSQHYKGPVRRILDMGCGTGGHALSLAEHGYDVTGVDASRAMIDLAAKKAQTLGLSVDFVFSPVESFRCDHRFDAVLCMFAVFSYLMNDDAINQTLATIHHHLSPHGILIFDFWNAAVCGRAFEKYRVKDIEHQEGRLLRISQTAHHPDRHLLEVAIKCLHIKDRQILQEVRETHWMRYYSLSEIKAKLSAHHFEIVELSPFLNPGGQIEDAFTLQIVARRR